MAKVTLDNETEETPCPCDPPCGWKHVKVTARHYFIDGKEVTREEARRALGVH